MTISQILQSSGKSNCIKTENLGFSDLSLEQKLLYEQIRCNPYYSKTRTSRHLWAAYKVSSTLPNFHLSAVFFVMESNIALFAYNLESK